MVEGFINYPEDYQLKYRWRGKSSNGTLYGLNIYIDTKAHTYIDEDPPVIETVDIEGLTSIQLEVQGGAEAVTAPIVKTQLRFSLVDAPDMTDANYKRGGWEEFFTPDAYKYLVELIVFPIPGDTTSSSTIWQGFITPDSWEEELRYHGSITITARDMIGHLDDFDADIFGSTLFDLYTVYNAIRNYLAMVQLPMDLEVPYDYSGAPHLRDATEWLIDASFHAPSQSEDKKASELLEDLLEATGYCLRWAGNAKYVLLPIRNLPLLEKTAKPATSSIPIIQFYGGTRILDPAYKAITETVKYEGSNELDLDIFRGWKDTSNHQETYTGSFYDTEDHATKTFTGRSIRNTGNNSKGGWAYGMGFMRAALCNVQSSLANEDGPDAMEQGMNLAANFASGQELDMSYRIGCLCTDITLKFKFARPVELKTSSMTYTVARLKSYMYQAQLYIKYNVPYASQYETSEYYWTGSAWSSTPTLITVNIATEMQSDYNFEVVLGEGSLRLGGSIDIIFHNLICRGDDTPDYGVFCRLTELKVALNKATRLKKNTVTTVNNDDYNVEEKRKPNIAPLSVTQTLLHPLNYENALYKYDSNGVPVLYNYNVRYRDTENTQPLPGQIHKQILCFFHEALSILEGDFGRTDRAALYTPGLFRYKDKTYLLHGGTFDVLRDRINSGMLREFIWYDDLWEDSVAAQLSVSSSSTQATTQALIAAGISEDKATALVSGETVNLTELEKTELTTALESVDATATTTTLERNIGTESLAFERQVET